MEKSAIVIMHMFLPSDNASASQTAAFTDVYQPDQQRRSNSVTPLGTTSLDFKLCTFMSRQMQGVGYFK
jgi:hypothetical protein